MHAQEVCNILASLSMNTNPVFDGGFNGIAIMPSCSLKMKESSFYSICSACQPVTSPASPWGSPMPVSATALVIAMPTVLTNSHPFHCECQLNKHETVVVFFCFVDAGFCAFSCV